jgi:hypothetical protein
MFSKSSGGTSVMANIPFFIEAWEGGQPSSYQLCHRIMCSLAKSNVRPLPFASTSSQFKQVLDALALKGIKPSIYVVNSLWAEELIMQIDPLMGETPMLLLRRDIHARTLTSKKELMNTTQLLRKLTQRQMALCGYSPQNAENVAECAAQCLLKFLNDGDFWHFARLSVLSTSTLHPV